METLFSNSRTGRKPFMGMTLKFMLLLFVLAIGSNGAVAQEARKISGQVKEAGSGEPVLGATVRLQGTTEGTITDIEGNFSFTTTQEASVFLVVSYVGYQKNVQSIFINGEDVVQNFEMHLDLIGLDDVIVTATANPKSALESSISVSSINSAQLLDGVPRNTAEIFRNLPGIRSESTGGEGNANITVRGVPMATGGAKYLQLHEDGLPVMLFGDIAFGNADIFLRADQTIDKVEVIRGGSASTFASNSPAGVINLISKDGQEAGGSIKTTLGLDFQSFRTDFEYGSPLENNVSFHIGGFYRQGNGPRDTGYLANSGGQIKANLTKQFKQGYARIYVKYLNDRAVGYMPMPVQVMGTNASPSYSSINNFDAVNDTPHSAYLLSNVGLGANGEIRRSKVIDGMNPMSTATGGEFFYEIGEGWTVTNKFRLGLNKGRFVSPFPAEVGGASSMAESIGGVGATINYANGPSAGQLISNPSSLNDNGLAMRVHLFDVEINSFNNFSNDLHLSKKLDVVDLTVGYYKGIQEISMSWLWNSYMMEVKGHNAALLDVTNAVGDTTFTTQGLIAYGVPFWGNCCQRNYDAVYNIDAPYASADIELDPVSISASVRYDIGQANGFYAGTVQSEVDINRDGNISYPEQSVSSIDNANTSPVNYTWDYLSYSLGVNYKVNHNQAAFARYSHGGRANADRLMFGPGLANDGSAVGGLNSDAVDQAELGHKLNAERFGIFTTAFYSKVEEQNYEATTQDFVNRKYTSMGVEFEGVARLGDFNIRGSATWTKAEISKDMINPTLEGNTPRRQADLIYNATAAYKKSGFTAGINVIGTTKSFAQDNNELIMPGFAQLNAFMNYELTPGLVISVDSNNVFNTIGITESEEGTIVENTTNVVRARSIAGRSTSMSLSYRFRK